MVKALISLSIIIQNLSLGLLNVPHSFFVGFSPLSRTTCKKIEKKFAKHSA